MKRLTVYLLMIIGSSTSQASLTFSQAYEAALQRALRIQSESANVEQFHERRLERVGAFLPTLSADVADRHSADPLFTPHREAFLNTSLNLFRAGGDIAGLNAANRDLESEREALKNARLAAEDEVVTALVSVIARTRQTKLNTEIVALKEEALRVARERFSKGLLAEQEVDKVEIELANAIAKKTDAEVTEASARSSLKVLLGSDDVVSEWPWRDVLLSGPHLEDEKFRVEDRPDFKSATLKLNAEHYRYEQTRSLLLPTIDLTAKYGYYDLTQSQQTWAAALTLTIPLFDGFSSWGALGIQQQQQAKAQIDVERVVRAAPSEIETLRHALRAARDSAVNREKTRRLCERLYSDNAQRFRLGRASVNDLAIDQNRLLETELLEVDGWSNAHLSFMQLCHAIGRSLAPNGKCE